MAHLFHELLIFSSISVLSLLFLWVCRVSHRKIKQNKKNPQHFGAWHLSVLLLQGEMAAVTFNFEPAYRSCVWMFALWYVWCLCVSAVFSQASQPFETVPLQLLATHTVSPMLPVSPAVSNLCVFCYMFVSVLNKQINFLNFYLHWFSIYFHWFSSPNNILDEDTNIQFSPDWTYLPDAHM